MFHRTLWLVACSYAYENSELDHDDDIPMRLWWDGNQARIDDLVHTVRGHLRGAMNVR